MNPKSLWPEKFDPVDEPTPEDVLDAQAANLEEKTGGRLTARVDVGSIGEKISLDFMVVAPALNGYEYRLFKVLHRVQPVFAAEFVVGDDKPVSVTSRKDFETQLARVLQSGTTVRLIAELLDLIARREKNNKMKKT